MQSRWGEMVVLVLWRQFLDLSLVRCHSFPCRVHEFSWPRRKGTVTCTYTIAFTYVFNWIDTVLPQGVCSWHGAGNASVDGARYSFTGTTNWYASANNRIRTYRFRFHWLVYRTTIGPVQTHQSRHYDTFAIVSWLTDSKLLASSTKQSTFFQ